MGRSNFLDFVILSDVRQYIHCPKIGCIHSESFELPCEAGFQKLLDVVTRSSRMRHSFVLCPSALSPLDLAVTLSIGIDLLVVEFGDRKLFNKDPSAECHKTVPPMDTTSSSPRQPTSPTLARLGAGDVGLFALVPAITCTTLATLTVALRWYTRCMISRCIGIDDYVILLSQILSWTMCAIIGASFAEGVGITKGAASSSQVAELILANNTIWTILINVTKASILTQYLRIFHSRSTRLACYVLLLALIPAACWGTFEGIFLCKPTAKLWSPVPDGRCGNPETYWSSVAAVDIFLDFAVLILPMPSIAGLRLPKRQKIATVLVFALGFLVCLVSVVRVARVLVTSRRGDYVRSGMWAIVWSVVEANVGIICACLLSLKALVTKLLPRLLDEEGVNPRHMRIASVPEEWRPGDSEAATLARSVGSRRIVDYVEHKM